MGKRPVTTLFLLQSLDGKISTGETDKSDVDKDIPNISGNPSKGLYQYYDAEMNTDLWSLNSGRVMAKVGVNNKPYELEHSIVNFVIIDDSHLTEHGVRYICSRAKKCVIVTSNKNHPAYNINTDNLEIISYTGKLNPQKMLEKLYNMGCKRITIQTGGTLNNLFLRNKCIDKVNVVICPIIVGGKNISTLVDGDAPKSLNDIGVLRLTDIKPLKHSYIEVFYDVVN